MSHGRTLLGKALRDARQHAGFTWQQVVDATGISKDSISRWEIHGGIPRRKKLAILAELYKVPLKDLLMCAGLSKKVNP